MWAAELIDLLIPGTPFDYFGIRPRVIDSVPGIICAPFLHLGFAHLIANSIPFLILGVLIAARRARDFAAVFGQSMLISGSGTWLFGTPGTIHIGASGVVFGLLGFVVTRGIFERSVAAVVLSIVALFLFGGMIVSLIPVQSGVSWSGHLFGFVGGIFAARTLPHR